VTDTDTKIDHYAGLDIIAADNDSHGVITDSAQSPNYIETGTQNPFILANQELKDIAMEISNFSALQRQSADFLTESMVNKINELWSDPAMKNTWRNRRRSHVMDNTPYFFDNMLQILSDGFELTFEEYVLIRDQTTGITVKQFEAQTPFGQYVFKVTDVGGQRSERRKWLKLFDNVNTVMFLMGLSGYDQVLFEDNSRNCLEERLDLFKNTCHNKVFSSTDWVIFFNKIDIFEDKIKHVPFTVYQPSFPEAQKHSSRHVREYIQQQFHDIFFEELSAEGKLQRGGIFFHYTCATKEESVSRIIHKVQIDIIKSQMKRMGYLM
jgi:hypothetical protein